MLEVQPPALWYPPVLWWTLCTGKALASYNILLRLMKAASSISATACCKLGSSFSANVSVTLQPFVVVISRDTCTVGCASFRLSKHIRHVLRRVVAGIVPHLHQLIALIGIIVMVAFLVIGKWQQRAPRKQSGKRKHELTLAVTGVALQPCNLAGKPSICCFEAIEKRRISTTLLICLENRAKKLPFNYL